MACETKMYMNFGNICRLCMLNCNSMMSLFNDNSVLPNRIMTLIPVLEILVDDSLPQQICQECVNQINHFYDFKVQCENSDIMLKNYFRKLRHSGSVSPLCGKPCRSSPEVVSSNVTVPCEQGDEKLLQDNIYKNEVKDEKVLQEVEVLPCESQIKEENALVIENHEQDAMASSKTKNISSSVSSLEETDVVCHICAKVVLCRRLKIHMRSHRARRPAKCNECGKTFAQRSNLKQHALVHSGLKAHMCDICGKKFQLFHHLNAHHLTHTGQKSHVCDVCGKRFSQLGGLKNHQIRHSSERPFKCDICDKTYLEKYTLQKHLAIHAGQKQHVCKICGKSFFFKDHVKSHMISHSGERKFLCSICGKSYARGHSLKKHKIKHVGL